MIETDISLAAPRDDLRNKVSPFLLTLCNAANQIADPVYLFLDPKREQAAALGRLVLRLAATKGSSIQAGPESSLSIYFPRELLSLEDVRTIQLDAASALNWKMELPAENEAPVILKPLKQCTITDEQTQTIVFSQVLATSGEPVRRHSIACGWEQFGGLEDDSRSCNATRELPPGAAEEKVSIGGKWGPRTEYYAAADTVYITPYPISPSKPGIANRLVLRLGNQEEGQLEKGQAKFTVTFPTTRNGDSLSALCTPEQLSRVQCVQVAPFQNTWRVDPMMAGEVPHWVLSPPADATTVFGQDTYVSFEFNGLVTEMMVAPCAAVVGWSGIKGRKSGALRVAIEKTAPRPAVVAFNARSGGREVRHGEAVDFKERITLDWRLFAADACRVEESEEGALRAELTLGPGDTKVVLPTKPSTIYTLTPLITLDGVPHRGTGWEKKFNIHPATARLWATPDRLAPSQTDTPDTYPTKTTLHWECASGDCFLSGPNLSRRAVERTGELEVTAAGPDQYLVESTGLTTAKAGTKVKIPMPFLKFTVGPSSTGVMKVTWKSLYARSVEVSGASVGASTPTCRDLNGTMDFASPCAWISARGAGSLKIFMDCGDSGTFPDVTAIAYIGAQGPVFRWAVTGANKVYVAHNTGADTPPAPARGESAMQQKTGPYSQPAWVQLSVVNRTPSGRNQLLTLMLCVE